MKTLVFGANGWLGKRFLERLPEAVAADADIADARAVGEWLDRERPDAVLNAAGKTGRPNVDWCEDHKEETVRSNVTGPLVLLEETRKRSILLAHVSSGCIYEGDKGGKGFSEDDPPNFFGSFYSRTKAWADQILKEFPVLILRLRMPFDGSNDPRNLITKIAGYERVLDVPNSVTHLPDFLDAAATLMQRNKTGIYHIVNPGSISPYRIMELYREIVDPAHRFERLTRDRLSDVAKAGRSNCLLSTAKLEGEGINLQPVEETVKNALKDMIQAKKEQSVGRI